MMPNTLQEATTPRDASRCPICLHAVTEAAAVKDCSHSFCLPCLRQWAASRPAPVCPLCKVPIAVLCRADGTEEPLPSPPAPSPDDAPPDLGCLDHAFFAEEARRLRRRVTSAQHSIAASRGRRLQDASAAEQLGHLGDVLDITISNLQEDSIPFDPEAMLKELYDLETALGAISEGGGFGGGVAATAAPRRLSAADALAVSDDDGAGGYGYGYSDSEEDEEEKMARQMDRMGLGRRRSSARGSHTSLAHAASSSSLGSTVSQKR